MIEQFLKLAQRAFWWALPIMVAVEWLSLLGYVQDGRVWAIGFFVTILVTAVLSFRDFGMGVLIFIGELTVGSQGGYLFAVGGANGGLQLSVRIGLFLTLFMVLVLRTAYGLFRPASHWGFGHDPAWWRLLRDQRWLWPYVTVIGIFCLAGINGYFNGNGFANVFFDANGYAFYGALPFLAAAATTPKFWARAVGVIAAGIALIAAKSLLVLYIFSHRMFDIGKPVYIWVRDTRVGEITRMGETDFYRVFFQAHVWALAVVILAALVTVVIQYEKRRQYAMILAAVVLSVTVLVMGLSRSFWFGGVVAVMATAAGLLWLGFSWRVWSRLLSLAAVSMLAGVILISVAYSLPFPRAGADFSFANLLSDRATSLEGEAAANSRWQLLPVITTAALKHPFVGSGFGTSVTYKTSDPRLLALIPSGEYTTYAFEWGYHDLWLKLGLLGTLILMLFLGFLFWPAFQWLRRYRGTGRKAGTVTQTTAVLLLGLLAGALAIFATNVFSPYLNHPLGISILLLAGLATLPLVKDSAK